MVVPAQPVARCAPRSPAATARASAGRSPRPASSAACGVPAPRRRLRVGTPSSPITRSALSSYPASSAAAASRCACRSCSVNPAAVAGRPASAQNPSSSGSHSAQVQQVGAPVGVLPGPGHGDVPGAQFLGQVGEHHRLEVAPGHHARVAAVGDRPPPVCRGERDTRLGVSPSTGGGSGMKSRRLTWWSGRGPGRPAPRRRWRWPPAPACRPARTSPPGPCGRTGAPAPRSCRRGRPTPPRCRPAGRRTRPPPRRRRRRGPPPRPAPGCRGLASGVEVFQHGAVGADQPLRRRALPQADLLQLRLGLLDVGRHPLAQHLGQVIAGPHPRGVHQARHQRQPLDRLVSAPARRVLGGRLPGEISDLARGDPLQPRARCRPARRPGPGTRPGP